MSNIPSNIDLNAVQTAVDSPVSKNSDDKELSWSNVEDTEDVMAEPVAEPVAESVAEPATEPVTEPATEPVTEPAVEPVEEPAAEPVEEPVAESEVRTAPSLTIDDTDDDMPELVSDESGDDMPELVSSSDEETDEETEDETDDEMPDLVSDDDDIVHMMIRDTNCLRCRTAIQTLLSHDHDYVNGIEEECTTLRPQNEFPSIITYILWLFIALHALNLVSTYCGQPSC